MAENILLLGGYVQALSVARSLKERNYPVHVLANNDPIARSSNFIDTYDNINLEDSTALDILINYLNEKAIKVIIPLEDSYAAFLSKNKEFIEERTCAQCAVMGWNSFSFVSNKTDLLKFCEENGIGHPKTARIEGEYEVLADKIGFPALIKPSFSEGAKGIVLVNTVEELKSKAPVIIQQYGECSLQEYIQTKDYYYNVMLYRTRSGDFGNSCVLKILRYYPLGGGSSSLCISIDNSKIVSLCKNLLNKLDWFGFADFDVLEKEDGDYRIIEINPRVPASLRGAAISGINYPEMIVSDLLTNEIHKYEYTPGKILRFLGLDLAWFVSSPKRFCSKPSWFNFFGKDLYYQDGGVKDFKAMLVYFFMGIKKQCSSDFRKSKKIG